MGVFSGNSKNKVFKKPSSTKSSSFDPKKQIANYNTRLENLGIDSKKATDKRNWLEKLLNLPENQGVLSDISEIIGRPQQALFGGIDAAQKGGDFWEGAKEGITGEKETHAGQLLRNAGMSGSGEFNLFDKDTWKEASPSDFLGFALDMFADPVDLAIMPVKAGSTAVKTIDTATDTAKAIKGAETLDDARKALNMVSDAGKELKGAKKVVNNILTKGAKPISDSGWARQSLSQMLFNTAGEGIKSTGKLADALITGSKTLSDNKITKKAGRIVEDLVKKGEVDNTEKAISQAKDNIIKELGGATKAQDWKDLKQSVKNLFQGNKKITNVFQSAVDAEEEAKLYNDLSRRALNNMDTEVRSYAKQFAEKAGMKEDEAYDFIKEALYNNRQYEDLLARQASKGGDAFNELTKKSSKYTFNGDKESIDTIKQFLSKNYPQIAYDVDDVAGTIKLNKDASKGWNDFLKEAKPKFDELEFRKPLGVSQEAENIYKQTRELIDNDEGLKQLNEMHRNFNNEATNEIMRRATGGAIERPTTFKEREDYVPQVLTKEYAEATRKEASAIPKKGQGLLGAAEKKGRKTESALQGNLDNYNNADAVSKINKKIQSAEKQLSRNATDNSVKEINRLEKSFNDNVVKAEKKLNELKIKTDNLKGSVKKYQEMRKGISDTISGEIGKKIKEAADVGAKTDYFNAANKLQKQINKVDSLAEQLASDTLTEVERKSLLNTFNKAQKDMEKYYQTYQDAAFKASKSISEKEAKLLDKVVKSQDNTIKAQKRLDKATDSIEANLEASRQIRQSTADMADSLEKNIAKEQTKLRTRDVANDAIIKDRIARLQKAKSTMETAGAMQKYQLDYFAAADAYINKNADYIRATKVYGDAALNGTFLDTDLVKTIDDLDDGKIPKNFTEVNGSILADNLFKVQNFLPEGSDTIDFFRKQFAGKKIYMQDDVARMLGFLNPNKTGDTGVLLKTIDKFNNMFKKFKTMTPGFHLRNWTGNSMNMYLSGVPMARVPEYQAKAVKTLNASEDILNKLAKGTKLTAQEEKTWDLLQQFYRAGFKEAGTGVQELGDVVKKYSKSPTNKLAKVGVKANEVVDNVNRMGLLMYASEHPNFLKKINKKTPIEAVRYALMDPTNISSFESKYMKRLIPFYTFTKQNLMFQATNMMQNVPRYHKVLKALDSAYDSLPENAYQGYQKDSMQLPTPFTDGKGNQLFLKTNLPLSDLGEFMSDPLRRTLSSTSPLIKTPIEMVTGQNIFSGQDAYYNTGNDLYKSITGKDMSAKGKDWAGKAEQLLAGLGVDTISTNLVKKVAAGMKAHNGDMDSQAMWAEIFRSILQNTNQDKIDQSRAYEEMEQLQQYIKGLKNQGIDVPTIREINAANKSKLNRVKRRRNSVFQR